LSAALNSQSDFVPEGDDISLSILSFSSGVLGSMTVSNPAKRPDSQRGFLSGWKGEIALYILKGSARTSIPLNTPTVKHEGGKEAWVPQDNEGNAEAAYLSSDSREIQRFADCLRDP
jgi:hypothetical protein